MIDSVFTNKDIHQVLQFAESLRSSEGPYGLYKYARSSPTYDLYGSCLAVGLREFTGDLDSLSTQQRSEWINLIRSWQEPDTGLILDPRVRSVYQDGGTFDWEYVSLEQTLTAASALRVLGGQPQYPFAFLDEYRTAAAMRQWLDNRNWAWPWGEGNNLLNIGGLLILDDAWNSRGQEAIDAFFDWLDEHVNPANGFWGTPETPDFVCMCGAMHEYMLYFCQHRPILYPEKIIDATLALQHEDGMFNPDGGGSQCTDIDAVILLVNMTRKTDYRQTDVRNSLQRCYHAIMTSGVKMPDGGFQNCAKGGPQYRRNGLSYVGCESDEPDMLSTLFRLGTLGLIETVLLPEQVNHWQFTRVAPYWYWLEQ